MYDNLYYFVMCLFVYYTNIYYTSFIFFLYYLCISFDFFFFFFFSSRRRHTRSYGDWSSDVCSSDLRLAGLRKDDDFRQARAASEESRPPSVPRSLRHLPPRCDRAAAHRSEQREGRSEERRVGKECRSRKWGDEYKKKREEQQYTVEI